MINLNLIEERFFNYKELKENATKFEEGLDSYSKEHKKELDYLIPIYKTLQKNPSQEYFKEFGISLSDEFLIKNPVLEKYERLRNILNNYKNEMYETMNDCGMIESCQRFIALKHDNDDDYSLLELYTQETIDLSGYSQEKVDFIVNMLKSASSFICFAKREDLPLLMNILEECDEELTYREMEPEDIQEEEYYTEMFKCPNMELEFIRAHMKDANEAERKESKSRIIRLNYPSEEKLSEAFDRLNILKEIIDSESYKEQYFYLMMLKEDIETLYNSANKEDKKLIIDTYIKLSQGMPVLNLGYLDLDHLEYRTASPKINIEVLKRKQKINNKKKEGK